MMKARVLALLGLGGEAKTRPAPKVQPPTDCGGSGEITASKPDLPRAGESTPGTFSDADRRYLLDLARATIRSLTISGAPAELDLSAVPASCRERRGCFVTLTKEGQLRGCIGNVLPAEPLAEAVMRNAGSAARHDLRFDPVKSEELDQIRIEISILSEPQPLPFDSPDDLLRKLRPGEDGVVLRIGSRMATFLPQVWSQLPDKVEFLSRLAQKAGCPSGAWRGPDVGVSIYRVEAFGEEVK